jgi:hypothetical protein
VVLEALMDQGLTEPKYLGLVGYRYKKLMRIPRDINGLRRVSEGQTNTCLGQNQSQVMYKYMKNSRGQ